MKIKEQTRKLAAGCSKQCFEVVDRTDEVSNHTYGKATLTWFEEIFEECEFIFYLTCPYSRSLSRLRVKRMIRCGHIYQEHHGYKVVAR